MDLNLPPRSVPDRISITTPLDAHQKQELAHLEGPGCIRHIFVVSGRHPRRTTVSHMSRRTVMRIYFDGRDVPNVEAPIGDLFGVMHGLDWYPINTPYLSVTSWKGYNCYFPMPFDTEARIEVVNGPEDIPFYLMVDWHRYPDATLEEPLRFCARWRREMPTQRYGDDYLLLDADGPGRLVGFVYGVRLIDQVDRWSHGGSDNIYLDGEGDEPAYLRGIGGEDTFGVGYGGALHPPETHHHAGMPYYVHEDVGEARPAQRLVGYRFFTEDTIEFERSLHLRFGSMANDIASTAYWYQETPVREFFELPDWDELLPGVEMEQGSRDREPPPSGEWWVLGPFALSEQVLSSLGSHEEDLVEPGESFDGGHEQESLWLTDASREAGVDRARWVHREAFRSFLDLNHCFRPRIRGVAVTYPAVAIARSTLDAPEDGIARLRIGWDDHLVLRINSQVYDLGHHAAFRAETIEVPLAAGINSVSVRLTNTKGGNHGGWAFSFHAKDANGSVLLPMTEGIAS